MSFKTYALEDVLEITSSKRIKMADYVQSGIPFYRSKEIIEKSNNQPVSTDIFITCEHFDKIKMKFGAPEAGDILLTSVGTLGVSYQVSDDDLFYFKDGNLTWFRNFNNRVLSGYIYCWLKSPSARKKLDEISIGTTQRALTIASLKKILIKIPSLDVQKKIVFIYESLSKKIINNGKINQTLEQMAQVLFKSWFVDFEPVKAKIAVLEAGGSQEDATRAAMTAISGKNADALAVFEREHPEQYAELKATAELFPSAMQDSELGEIPVGWSVSNIKNNVDVRDGTHASPKASDSGYHLVTSKNITSGYLDRRSCYYISDANYHEVNKRSRVSRGDILISMIGTVGALYFVAENNVDYAIKNIGLIRTSERPDLQSIIFYHLKSNNGINYINSRLAGTTQKYLSLKQLREIPIVMPTNDVLAAFNNKTFLHEIHANQEITETLANIRDTLLPKLLSGEITLPEAEQIISEEA